ncbi:ankyrin repeat-containing protein [European chub iridovirus]|nr:ankyrin repeat-containing protein [European chub iridovirus]
MTMVFSVYYINIIFSIFIQHKMDHINQFDAAGVTPLLRAIINNDFQMVELLIRHGVNVNKRSADNQMIPIHAALQLLLQNLNNQNAINIFGLLLERDDMDVNAVDSAGNTILVEAINHHHTENIIDFILEHTNVDVNIPDATSKTPLILATYSPEIVRKLIHKGANINAQTQPMRTTAVEILFNVQVDEVYKRQVTVPILEMLLHSPYQTLDINANTLRSIIDYESINPLVLEYLLYFATANIDFGSPDDGVEAPCYAALVGDLDSTKILVRYLNYNLQHIMLCSVQSKNTNVMNYLLEEGVDFNETDMMGNPALKYALEAKSSACVDLLLAKNIGLTPSNAKALGSLVKSIIKQKDIKLIEKIHDLVPSINLAKSIYISKSKGEMTPLEYFVHHSLSSNSTIEFIKQFIDYTAPRYGFSGFIYEPPQWFKDSADLMKLYADYNKLYYKCILSADRHIYEKQCKSYAMPHFKY